MGASSVAQKLRKEQATCHFFCDVAGVLSTVADACASRGMCPQLQGKPWQDVQAVALSMWAYLCCNKQGLACVKTVVSRTGVRFDAL